MHKNQTGYDGVKKAVDQLNNCIGALSISVKYLIFDLEATQRELSAAIKENEELKEKMKKNDPS